MRNPSWKSFACATLALLGGVEAATTPDLATLLSQQSNLTTFYSLIKTYPNILLQLPSYQGVTILAPNNDAFNKIPYTVLNNAFKDGDEGVITNVLEYHLLQGTRTAAELVPGAPVFIPTLLTNEAYSNVTGGQVVENVEQAGNVVIFVSGQGSRSTLVQADLAFTGGVVQVIDSLLIPPGNVTQNAESYNLTSFEGALYKSNLLETISSASNVTLFAPQNYGFQALGPAIANMTVEELTSVMDYHYVAGEVLYSTDLTNGTKILASQGENITITHAGNNVYINSAQLLTSDILLANGVMHVIDNVINPQGPGAQPNPAIATQGVVFASASMASDLPFTSDIPCSTSCPVTTTSSASGSAGAATTTRSASTTSTTSFSTSKSKGAGAAKETGMAWAGLVGAVGVGLIL
ncbi:hypothetical protein BP5796_01734 [Coleophoma crateriformis]|uniref:FAS1 domain-containing protein n=1 Tax=Coleophoma crateriformis TaxID=565419 RepID=A0A3D8T1D8_9HELO|nr:hypothetical protein BP5796_01734 [Coleophoma crateriformis]